MKPLDRLLEALRATGPDSYRADPDRLDTWLAYCPGCASRLLDIRRLTIRERDGQVTMTCSTGCSTDSIFTALKVCERLYPNGTYYYESPADTARVAELLLNEGRERGRLIRAIQSEASQ